MYRILILAQNIELFELVEHIRGYFERVGGLEKPVLVEVAEKIGACVWMTEEHHELVIRQRQQLVFEKGENA